MLTTYFLRHYRSRSNQCSVLASYLPKNDIKTMESARVSRDRFPEAYLAKLALNYMYKLRQCISWKHEMHLPKGNSTLNMLKETGSCVVVRSKVARTIIR